MFKGSTLEKWREEEGGRKEGRGQWGGVVDRKARGLVSFLQQLRSSDVVVNV